MFVSDSNGSHSVFLLSHTRLLLSWIERLDLLSCLASLNTDSLSMFIGLLCSVFIREMAGFTWAWPSVDNLGFFICEYCIMLCGLTDVEASDRWSIFIGRPRGYWMMDKPMKLQEEGFVLFGFWWRYHVCVGKWEGLGSKRVGNS